jgi:shikimate kinase
MSNELRAQFMKEALTNKAFALIGNAPAPTPEPAPKKTEPQQTTTTTKEQSAPTTEEVRDRVSAKLIELGQELEAGKDVVAEINKFGSFAHQTLKMSEGDINALIQQGVDKVKTTQETEREELRKLGKELAENDMAEGDDDFYAENGLTIQDEIDATIGNGVLNEDEARNVVKEAYDSVYTKTTTEILIPDEEESQDIPAEDNHEDELDELVLVSLEGENKAASASVMARFVLDNTDGNMEEATEIVRDILSIFSSVDEIIELDNGLVISGVLVRDGQSHKVVVTEDFQGSILA